MFNVTSWKHSCTEFYCKIIRDVQCSLHMPFMMSLQRVLNLLLPRALNMLIFIMVAYSEQFKLCSPDTLPRKVDEKELSVMETAQISFTLHFVGDFTTYFFSVGSLPWRFRSLCSIKMNTAEGLHVSFIWFRELYHFLSPRLIYYPQNISLETNSKAISKKAAFCITYILTIWI